jgi:putative membrane protein
MGAADIVPGVSGGTVALVLGIYERLIDNIRIGAGALRHLVTGDLTATRQLLRRIEWVWLLSLLGGILLAVAALSSLIEHLLEEQPVRMSALFLGLVLGAIWVAWRLLARVDAAALALMIGVGLAMFLLLGLRADTSTATDAAAEVVTEPAWIFFLSGALAICAMILPGISGSFILVLIGMYDEVLGAVNERDFAVLGAFALGCIIGLALFSTLLSWLLDNYHNLVIAALIGLMIGSTRVLWPWPGGTETTTLAAPEGDVLVPVLLIVLGLVVVVVVETVATQLTSAASRSMPSEMSSSPRANENRP